MIIFAFLVIIFTFFAILPVAAERSAVRSGSPASARADVSLIILAFSFRVRAVTW